MQIVKQIMSHPFRWKAPIGAALFMIVCIQPGVAQQPTTTWTPEEQAAIDVVNAWDTAWASGQADKVASYMSDDVQFSDGVGRPFKVGRKAFVSNYLKLYFKIVKSYEITETYAAGGATAVAVMQKRIDHIVGADGRESQLPFVGMFQVAKGEITFWVDVNIAPFPPGLGPPPTAENGGAR
jgi:uncharacterized protein (TIGR02246 family)